MNIQKKYAQIRRKIPKLVRDRIEDLLDDLTPSQSFPPQMVHKVRNEVYESMINATRLTEGTRDEPRKKEYYVTALLDSTHKLGSTSPIRVELIHITQELYLSMAPRTRKSFNWYHEAFALTPELILGETSEDTDRIFN